MQEFDATLDKLHSTTSANQKDKLEADLKKEIKKLQRLRDQIKQWIASPDIKDKKQLTDNRRLIEQQMERFKAIEKEMKTKAFSKEGLNQHAKIDPKEKEKMEASQWLTGQVDELNTQVEKYEAEIEVIRASLKKGKKETPKMEKIARLDKLIERHKWHIGRLELIHRMLENESVSYEQVNDVKDNVAYYMDSHHEDDFEEDEEIYDELNLDEEEALFMLKESTAAELEKTKEEEALMNEPKRKLSEATIKIVPNNKVVEKRSSKEVTLSPLKVETAPVVRTGAPVVKPTSPVIKNANQPLYSVTASIRVDKPESSHVRKASVSSSVLDEGTSTPGTSKTTSPKPASIPPPMTQVHSPPPPPKPIDVPLPVKKEEEVVTESPQMMTPPQDKEPMPPVQEVVVEAPPPPLPLPPQPYAQAPPSQKADESSKLDNQSISSLVDLIPILDAAHSEAEQRDSGRVLELFEAAHARIPAYEDIERTKPYNPRNIFATAAYYPQKPATVSEQFVKRLDESTLFFIFYYQPGTFQQYLAARELMRNSWRYHKQSRQWFKRREPPVESSVDYEFGTFTVFDQEGAWCDRRKPDFKFEYAHLERYGLSDV